MSWKAFKAYFNSKYGEFWTQTTLAVNAQQESLDIFLLKKKTTLCFLVYFCIFIISSYFMSLDKR